MQQKNITYNTTVDLPDLPPSPKQHKTVHKAPISGPSLHHISAQGKSTVPPKIRHKLPTVKPRKVETENATSIAKSSHSKVDSDNKDSSSEVGSASSVLSATPSTNSAAVDKSQKIKHEFVSRTVGLIKFKRKRTFKCGNCDNTYPTQAAVSAHYRETHDIVKCSVYHKTFTTPATLSRHMYSHEIATKACRCGKTFRFDSELKSHKLTHRHITMEHCAKPGCNKSYFSASDLAKHVLMHSDKIWNCPECDYNTKDKQLLKSHKRKHEQTVQYTCLRCGKGFVYYTQWSRHKKAENCTELKCSSSPEV